MTPQIMRRKDLEKRLGISRSSIYLMMSEGRFPKTIKLGRRAVGWRADDIQTWLDELQEGQNA
jgi:prophage regulatory protein